ncbi:IDEAL domain-containing protein [Lentibacillus halodurans]|uniref:IDEAL domain-containing protein n=1 Tax=Lentibacillus halodurans TaxID=237679 RepID=A0A1I0WHH6_9BACI|nr:IDEAL domain-containing protein [Lentibacillus halodurans]SFA87847.1 IDEAL domain-containing protein [Lentibacillus halodurans]
MATVKMLRPYYIKVFDRHVLVILEYQYFAMVMDNHVYQFIPTESREIRINRKTQKIENVGARFAFQKGNDIIYMNMSELMAIPDFLVQLREIVKPYYIEEGSQENDQNSVIIDELERMNVKRLIDKALDNRDKKTFEQLLKLL